MKVRKYNIMVIAASLCVATTSFAGGFGVGDQASGMPATALQSGGSQAAVNQLLGQDQSPGFSQQSTQGGLTSGQIQEILKNQRMHQGIYQPAPPSQQQSASQPMQQQQRMGATAAPQEQSAASLPVDNSFGDSSMSQQAFANMLRGLMPLSPEQIKTLRQLYDSSQRAAAAYPGTPPKPTSSSVVVNLSPGAAPPIIRLRSGFVTSLVFLDSTGEPWPIQAYDIGDPNSFNVQWNQKGNTLLVQSNTTYKSGNLAVMLKGQDTPVMITLMPGQRAVDYRVDMRVPGFGPNASPTVSNLPDTANPQLLSFLNGIPPNGVKTLQVEGGPCQAWLSGGNIYLRTTLTVLSPSWLASMSSPDGTHVYEITKTPVVLASYRGKVVQLTVEGF